MTEFQRPEGWTDEQEEAYFGGADDPMEDEPVPEDAEILDLYALYDPSAIEGGDDQGTVA
jgi:hypothetical protein